MKLVRWSPLEEMSLLKDQIDRIFEPFSASGDERLLSHSLPVEVTETQAEYRVRLLVPGIDPEKINLQMSERELSVSTETQPRELEEGEMVHMNQFRYGKFSKQLSFPQAIDQNQVQANYTHGVLTITLPKAENNKRKTIPIHVQAS